MVDRLDDAFRFYQTSLALRSQRQEVLAANIANADTPGYKARDFNFSQALREATGHRDSTLKPLAPPQLTLTSARHIPAQGKAVGTAAVQYRVPLQPSLDGNTVDMDVERVNFADNTARYQASLTVVSSRVKSLLTALQQ